MEKRRTRTTGSQAKATTQTTLKDLFQRTHSGTRTTEKAQDLHVEHTDPRQAVDPQTAAQPSRPSKPSQPFPIFTKAASVRERLRDTGIGVDNTEVIDISDSSADIEVSTEPSTHQLSPRFEISQPTSPSLPPSPLLLDENDTSLSCAGTREHTASKINELNKRTAGFGQAAPLPSSCSQHVRGLQHFYTASQAPLKRSVFSGSRRSDEGPSDFLATWQLDDTPSTSFGRVCRSLTPQQCEGHLQSLGRDYTESHPVFAQMSGYQEGTTSRHAETWTRRFRPRRANEVLGNERHALYLRDWLSALEVRWQNRQPGEPVPQGATARESASKRGSRGIKRPRVIRAVTRQRGNKRRRVDSDDDLDDFVVFSEGDEDPPEVSEDEFAFCQRTLTRLHRRGTNEAHAVTNHQSAANSFGDNLTNTLLITGPPGCGKTAAVYACAEELGWDVFEVYPGIGRRNGASLEHLVGDVGRNHIVQTVHRRGPGQTEAKERMGLDGYLANGKARQITEIGKRQEAGTEGQPIDVEEGTHEVEPRQQMVSSDEAISETWHAECEGSRPIVRQSLVLLEEVDILFKEDAGFWPAVVEFLRGCQRPVVMTCNDAGLVPVGDLPLQRVLVFEPCPSPVAATFLQCVSLTEGCLVPHEDLVDLYEGTHGIEVPDGGGCRRTEGEPLPDLRRSITRLQIVCAGARQGSPREEAGGRDRGSGRAISVATPVGSEWWKMSRDSELMSHVDAELCRPGRGTEAVCAEEETGHVVLSTEGREGRDELIAGEAMRHSRGAHETGPSAASINPAARLTSARVACALQAILAPPAPLVPQRSVFVDYVPWVRHMVGVEDELERRSRAVGGGRCTRNSMGTRYARCIGLREGEREVLGGARFI